METQPVFLKSSRSTACRKPHKIFCVLLFVKWFSLGDMTIWILALVLLASLAALGYRQGAVRVLFSFAGIVFAGLLAAPLGEHFKPLMSHLGIHNPALIWMLGPLEAFVLVLILFKIAG